MKRLFFLSMIFALIASTAFAADVGAEIIGMTNILSGDTTEDSKVQAGGWPGGLRRARAYAGGQNEAGTFGGWFRFETYGPGNPDFHGNAWWKPIDQFKLMLGVNPDGDYGRDGVTRWGFYQVGGDSDVIHENWAFGESFYAGWNKNGALLTITPIENLLIFLGIPFSSGGEAADMFAKLHAQVAYDISGIGNFAITYTGGLGHKDKVAPTGSDTKYGWIPGATESDPPTWGLITTPKGGSAEVNDPGKIYAYFGLSAIENLGIDIGLGYTLPYTREDKTTVNTPIAVGLGVKFDSGAFGVKARIQGQLGGSKKPDSGTEWKDPTVIDFDILPYYAVTDTVTALLSAGLHMSAPGDNDYGTAGKPDAVTGWHVEPYLTVKSSWWAPNFYAGFRLESDGVKGADDKSVVNWSVPIGVVFSF
jgi:hypothetical protein